MTGLQAISLSDGKQIWNYDFSKERGISSVITFSDKYGVYISYKSNLSTITLVDLSSGKEKWSVKSNKIWHKPAAMLNNNFVISITGPPKDWNDLNEYDEMELDDAKLTAYKIEDGSIKWEIELSDEKSDLLAITNENAFISFDFDFSDSGLPKNKVKCFSATAGNEIWEYDPSGMVNKVMVGGLFIFNNDVYTYPQYGGNGQIAKVDLKNGAEKWNNSVFNQRSFIPMGSNLYNSSSAWQGFKASSGDELFIKSLVKSSFSFGDLIGSMFGSSAIGLLVGSVANIATTIAGLFPEEGQALTFIPTQYLFDQLWIEDVVNDRGIFSIVRVDGKVTFVSMSDKGTDEKKIVKKFPAGAKDLSLSNGTNDNSIFATSKGKVYSINISDGSIGWEKDFAIGNTSIGIVIYHDKMLLFTDKVIAQLENE